MNVTLYMAEAQITFPSLLNLYLSYIPSGYKIQIQNTLRELPLKVFFRDTE